MAVVILATAAPVASAQQATPAAIEQCDARVRDRPDLRESFDCYLRYSETTRDGAGALARLEALADAQPDNPRALLALAAILQFRNAKRANELGVAALEGFRREGDIEGQAWARLRLLGFYSTQLRLEEAAEQGEQALALARTVGAEKLVVRIQVSLARLEYNRGDFAAAWLQLRRLEVEPGFATADADVRANAMQLVAHVAGHFGLTRTAHEYARRAVDVARSSSDARRERANLDLLGDSAAELFLRGEIKREELAAVAGSIIDAPPQGAMNEIAGRMTLAKISSALGDHDAALGYLRDAERISESDPFCRSFISHTRMNMGRVLLAADPSRADEALELLEGAVEAAGIYGTRHHLLQTLLQLVHARLETGPSEAAVATGLKALDAIESLTDQQSGDETAARLLAALAPTYHALVDYLLEPAGHSPTAEEVALAFSVSERLRSRRLLAHLDAVRELADPPAAGGERREEILEAISRLQLELLAADVSAARRAEARRELRALEIEEETLRGQLDDGGFAAARRGREALATLDSLAETLSEDEAVLDFIVTPDTERSWLIAVTRRGARVRSLSDHATLAEAVSFWRGVLQRGDGTDHVGAARLHDELLGDLLAELPATVESLIVIPDGPLHGIPFDALRPSREGRPLVERYQVSFVPSATFWLRVRRSPARPDPFRALLLADPAFPEGEAMPDELRAVGSTGLPVGRLPHARDEARTALRAFRGKGELLFGEDASEARLKQASLGDLRVLHLAAHAILDDRTPARSAILLAPGDPRQDGLLQAREIVDLNLGGALVTLSACRSAGGAVIPGEGVMGLARSFFLARAGAVVGGLWPLRDRDTATLMESFYRQVGAGKSVAAALTEAKREMARAGRPAAEWAGLVVLGDGSRVPWSGDGRASRRHLLPVLGPLAVLVLLALVVHRVRSRRA